MEKSVNSENVAERGKKLPFDLQKASVWKRISAFLFDAIMTSIIAVLFVFLISLIVGYDKKADVYETQLHAYEQEYGTSFSYSEEEFNNLPEDEKEIYMNAYRAFTSDETVLKNYALVMNLTLLMATLGILFAFLVWELFIPMKLGNGRTLGKKIFGLGVMRTDAVKLTNVQLFIRSILGKYTLETMVPVLIIIMIYFNMLGLTGTIVCIGILIVQVVLMITTHTNSCIHDLMAVSVVIDMPSQMIFDTYEEMIKYKEEYYAEKAAKAEY